MANTVDRMAETLEENFDYISKLDAVFYLRDLYPESTMRCRVDAWKIAYSH